MSQPPNNNDTLTGGGGDSSNPPETTGGGGGAAAPVMQPSPLQRPTATTTSGGDTETATTTTGGASAGGNDQTANNNNNDDDSGSKYDAQTQMVLDFLKQKGMNQAALVLAKKLDAEKSSSSPNADNNDDDDDENKSPRDRFMEEEEKMRAQRTLLTKTTGGGYGYDRDSAWPVVQWGVPDTTTVTDLRQQQQQQQGAGNTTIRPVLGVEEARSMVDAFLQFQLWVLNLPDSDDTSVLIQSPSENPILRAQKAMLENKDSSVADLIQIMVSQPTSNSTNSNSSNTPPTTDTTVGVFNLPPSVKSELLSVAFALFVHTYADLLEVGMETTSQQLRDAFAPVYQPLYPKEFRDLTQCTSTEAMMRLNSHNSQHMEAVGKLKQILVQVASYQLQKDERLAHLQQQNETNHLTQEQLEQRYADDPKVKDCDMTIQTLQSKYKEMSLRATQWFDKMHDLPFLRRARATRWILTISTSTYNMLAAFLSSSDESLVAMSTLLQTKCTLQVEKRDPLPYTPSCVLMDYGKDAEDAALALNDSTNGVTINWAVPAPRPERTTPGETPPFPKFFLQKEYETEEEAVKDLQLVQFNRDMLIRGFRRLAALERKREYEVLTPLAQKRAKRGEGTLVRTNPLEPSILISTLSASAAQPAAPVVRGGGKKNDSMSIMASSARLSASNNNNSSNAIASIWEEPGVGICCSQACSLGRRVAAGCDDAAVRIYDLEKDGGEPIQVLIGHKNGFPVFDVDWNRDGRAVLSAGGDGSVRLWDTMATGPFGETTTPKPRDSTGDGKRKGQAKQKQQHQQKHDVNEMEMGVPGWRAGDPVAYTSGAAIAVYRGHAPNTPVWSVSFAPCGYYFCSAGADATARIWTTDRPAPVRLLSGHTSANVNCVGWHPNANYVVTGSDDKTARLWDIQTGQTVRILMGASAGINAVRISPGGRYCAGADHMGQVHVWDLGSGRKISLLRSPESYSAREQVMIHSLSFSRCGQALATGGDDCCVRIWDIRTLGTAENEAVRRNPYKTFPTRRTVVMDLQYTKRNLLLAVGKYVSPVPLVSPVAD